MYFSNDVILIRKYVFTGLLDLLLQQSGLLFYICLCGEGEGGFHLRS